MSNSLDLVIYVISISLQLAGALLLLIFSLSTKRQAMIRTFAGKGIIFSDGNTGELSYNEDAFKAVFRVGYMNKCAFIYIALGYISGVFGDIAKEDRMSACKAIILSSALLVIAAYLVIEVIIRKSHKVSARITMDELAEAGIQPDIETMSTEAIMQLLEPEENDRT